MEPQSENMPGAFSLRWAQRCFIAAIFLLPLIVVPLAWFPFLLLKTSVVALLMVCAVVLFSISAYQRGGYSFPRRLILWAVIALPVSYGISTLMSQNMSLSLIGTGGEVHTLFFAVFLSLVAVVGSVVITNKKSLVSSLFALAVSLTIVALFQVLQIAFGPNIFGMTVFSTLSSNVVGRWNDFGIVIGLLAVISMVTIDMGVRMSRLRGVCAVVLILALGLVATVNLDSLWIALAGAAAFSALVVLMRKGTLTSPMLPQARTVPYASALVLVISALCIAWGTPIGTFVSTITQVSEFEVRPAFSTTVDIARSTYEQSPRTMFFGTGPGTFIEQWHLYKPSAVNTTQFWNLDFNGGSSVVTTAFVTTGLVGGVVWCLVLVLLLVLIFTEARREYADPLMHIVVIAAGIGALFVLGTSFLYLSGQVPLLIAFLLLGVALAAQKMSTAQAYTFMLREGGVVGRVIGVSKLLALFVVSLGVAVCAVQHLAASIYVGRALTIESDLARMEMYANKALTFYRDDATLRILSNIKLSEAQAISNEQAQGDTPSPDQAERFQVAFSSALEYAQGAIEANPRNYQNHMLLAQLFETLVPLNVSGAHESAKRAYAEAVARNPSSPGLFLSAARMEAVAGDENGFREAIQSAFSVKPNFTEAALLVVQFEVARNNIDGAIIAAQVAAQTAPQNAGVLFQLGLLQFAKGDAAASRDAFEAALGVQPDYANAKYFLGLTYQKLQRTQEAIALFQDLRTSNPDNEEVALILENMQAGRDPFANSEPPITPNPETRDTPPISE